MKTIGVIKAVSKRQHYEPRSVQGNGPQSLAAGSLSEGLAANPAVDLGGSEGAQQSLSVEGHDPSQTTVSAEGGPLAPPGSPVNLRAIDTGVFDLADVNAGSSADFHIPDPTLAFSASSSVRYASYDQPSGALFARGTSGFIGYFVGFSHQTYTDPIKGLAYLEVARARGRRNGSTRVA